METNQDKTACLALAWEILREANLDLDRPSEFARARRFILNATGVECPICASRDVRPSGSAFRHDCQCCGITWESKEVRL